MHGNPLASLCEGPAAAPAVEPAMVSAVTSVAARARMRRVNMDGSVLVVAGESVCCSSLDRDAMGYRD